MYFKYFIKYFKQKSSSVFAAQLRSTLAAHIVCCRGRPRTRRALEGQKIKKT